MLLEPFRVAVLAESAARVSYLASDIDSTRLAVTRLRHAGLIRNTSAPILEHMKRPTIDIVLIDLDPETPEQALAMVQMIHGSPAAPIIFVIGDLEASSIADAVRAGATEFLDCYQVDALQEAFLRFHSQPQRMGGLRAVTRAGGNRASLSAIGSGSSSPASTPGAGDRVVRAPFLRPPHKPASGE